MKLCGHPNLGIGPIVCKFHVNLRDRIDSIVFMRGMWVPFDRVIINAFFKLEDGDSKEYRAVKPEEI